jgi:hypothetical protein
MQVVVVVKHLLLQRVLVVLVVGAMELLIMELV